MADFSTIVRRERGGKSWTKEELADIAGVNVRTITRIEHGDNVQFKTLVAVLKALGKDLTVIDINKTKSN